MRMTQRHASSQVRKPDMLGLANQSVCFMLMPGEFGDTFEPGAQFLKVV